MRPLKVCFQKNDTHEFIYKTEIDTENKPIVNKGETLGER